MGRNQLLVILAMLAVSVAAPPASAQALSDDSAVWSVIERAWAADQRGDSKWVDELVAPDFVGWPRSSPAPRDRRSTRLWVEYAVRQTEMVEHELYPLSIVVHGDVAIAHYLYSAARHVKGQPVADVTGRYTDVLVRVDGQWKFLSRSGGDF